MEINRKDIAIVIHDITLEAILIIPENAKGIILFAHGSGSGRMSPRNNFIADILNNNGFATLLADLLTEKEDMIYENRFNIDLLTERLQEIIRYIKTQPETGSLSIGLFGASTGAAAALKLAAVEKDIFAVVSRGGRPDLAGESLSKVNAPTLLIVGGDDTQVLALNRDALEQIESKDKNLVVVPGATHLFEEPGTLQSAANYAVEWFEQYAK